jgi:hypothetical protein
MKNRTFLEELPCSFKKNNVLPVLYGLLKAEPLNSNPETSEILLEAESRFYKSYKSPCEKFYKPISKIC